MRPVVERLARVRPLYRWLLWLIFIVLWTAALLEPIPEGPWDLEPVTLFGVELKLLIAKAVHVSTYAALAVLTGWLRVPGRLRWLPLFFITVHGTLTELLQLLTPTRTGMLTDVGFDNVGVALGLLLSWKWWSAPDARESQLVAANHEESTTIRQA
jgi:VanZ family protein